MERDFLLKISVAWIFLPVEKLMQTKEPRRQEATEAGRNEDPKLRDESAQQPGVNTISTSDYDKENEELTETAKDDFRPDTEKDKNADKRFDEEI